MPEIVKLAEESAKVGEGPIWDADTQNLLWTDIQTGRLFRYDPATGTNETIHNGHYVGGFAVNKQGGLLQCIWDGVVLWRSDDDWVRIHGETYEGERLQFNDISADPEGRVFAGSFLDDGLGKLYRFDPDGSVTIAEEGVGCSNGIGFSPDHRTMYHTDSTKRTIYAYDYDQATGDITNRRDFIKLVDTEGVPDGMTVDAEGYIWTAVWFGGCIVRFDPDGTEEQRIHLPAYQTSSVMFGGNNLTDIYVTSANFLVEPGGDLDPADYDWSAYNNGYRGGGLFVIKNSGFQGKEEYKSDFAWPDR
ncbi:uncharacterized protein METZ01_LOCUS267093 [marine metagenome]|uniref:SMP-30/Gluconolactonase/LRE-like region domain-containing protein n=1 Tax=marine metagenome TaxID=408172 RepID=A0A382JR78_9ZZZZ